MRPLSNCLGRAPSKEKTDALDYEVTRLGTYKPPGIRANVAEEFDISLEPRQALDTSLGELGLDSVAVFELLSMIESELGLPLPLVSGSATLSDLFDLCQHVAGG